MGHFRRSGCNGIKYKNSGSIGAGKLAIFWAWVQGTAWMQWEFIELEISIFRRM